MTRLLAVLIGACLLLPGGDAAAQTPFLLLVNRQLEFGQVTPGVPTTVTPTDVTRRAELRLQGRGTAGLRFTLPAYLEHVSGARLPLSFSPADGLLVVKGRSVRFDPATGVEVKLNPADEEAEIYLGGTAQPAARQRAGTYTAVLTVYVIPNGI